MMPARPPPPTAWKRPFQAAAFGQPDLEVDRRRDRARDAAQRRHFERLLHAGRPEVAGRHALGERDLRFRQRELRKIGASGRRVRGRADEERNAAAAEQATVETSGNERFMV